MQFVPPRQPLGRRGGVALAHMNNLLTTRPRAAKEALDVAGELGEGL